MSKTFFELNIDTAFEDKIGSHGADRQRFTHWSQKLAPALPRILSKPQREAAPLFALPTRTDDLKEIEDVAHHIAEHYSTLVVAGMGGSSLSGETLVVLRKSTGLTLHFIDNIDPHSMAALTEQLPWKETAFLIISKSGNTVETLAQMAILLRLTKAHVGSGYGKQFWVITIPNGNTMHTLAQKHGMRVLAHDVDLGGRFSVFSLVGLIPAAAVGLDIRAIRAGAHAVMLDHNNAAQSAALHMALIEKQIRVNVTMHYCDRLGGLANWYRQCWAESLGKRGDLVTTPVRSRCATDQHSQLQLYLDGPKDKLFSVMMLECAGQGETIDYEPDTDPRLNFLNGKTLGDLMAAQQRATMDTLVQRGAPVRSFIIRELDETCMGAMLMHCALEVIFVAELLGVNAFDQPAVEDGKILALKYLGV